MNLNLPQEKQNGAALFLGTILIASILSSAAYWLIQKNLPPPPAGCRDPLWLAATCWGCGLFLMQLTKNIGLRAAVLLWVLARVIFWVSYGHEGGAVWLAAKGIYLTAGLLMVVIGARSSKPRLWVAALFLLVGASAIQYHAEITYAKALGYISIIQK